MQAMYGIELHQSWGLKQGYKTSVAPERAGAGRHRAGPPGALRAPRRPAARRRTRAGGIAGRPPCCRCMRTPARAPLHFMHKLEALAAKAVHVARGTKQREADQKSFGE